jgi:hypothetical protein
VEGGEENGGSPLAATIATRVKALKLTEVPKIVEPLKDEQLQRVALLPSTTVRGFEVVFSGGGSEILLSSKTERDLKEYLGVMESVYGTLDVLEITPTPAYLKEIPSLVGLSLAPAQTASSDTQTRQPLRAVGRLASSIRRRLRR